MAGNILACHNDADGIMSAAIMSKHMSDTKFEVLMVKGGTDSATEVIVARKPDFACVIDYCPGLSAMRKIARAAKKVVFIDHHAGSPRIAEKLELSGICAESEPAACALTYQWCYKIGEIERMPRAVRLVHYNDIGRFDVADVRAFRSYLHHVMPDLGEYQRMLSTDVDMEIGIGKRLAAAARTRDGAMLRRSAFPATYNGLKLLCINGYVTKEMFDLCHDATVDAFMGFQQVKPFQTNVVLISPPWRDADMRELIATPAFLGARGKCAAQVQAVSFSARGELRFHLMREGG
jgi:hypothetical protein